MTKKRNRFKQDTTLQARLTRFASDVRHEAEKLPPGEAREALLKKLRSADAAMEIDAWASTDELNPPV
jgi:hypothetical protein